MNRSSVGTSKLNDMLGVKSPFFCFPGGGTITEVFFFFLITINQSLDSILYPVKRSRCFGFPGGSVEKNQPANTRDMGSIPGRR